MFLHKSAEIHPYSSSCLKLGKELIYMATCWFRLLALGCLFESLTGDINPWTPLNSYIVPLDLCTVWFTLVIKLTLVTTFFLIFLLCRSPCTTQITFLSLNLTFEFVCNLIPCFHFLTLRRPCIVFPSELKQCLKGLGSGNFASQSGELPRQPLQGGMNCCCVSLCFQLSGLCLFMMHELYSTGRLFQLLNKIQICKYRYHPQHAAFNSYLLQHTLLPALLVVSVDLIKKTGNNSSFQ